ncbi:unnamed protein product [Closterium sp. NIES-54]
MKEFVADSLQDLRGFFYAQLQAAKRHPSVTWDRGEMKEFVADSPQDLRGFYAQLQAAKRNLVPRRDQVYDELVHVTSDLARAVAEWRQQNKLPERVEEAHWCTGGNCTFHRIENVFLCEKTGRAHVCDDNCAELLEDAESQMLVCAISGRCVDRMLSPQEEFDHQRAAEEAASTCQPEELQEPFMGAGRFGLQACRPACHACYTERQCSACATLMIERSHPAATAATAGAATHATL